ncbi:MAG: protein-L-isoaspartate(D-aspartate) O-methyltransferase [Candidatus Zipacnadales bacterium]
MYRPVWRGYWGATALSFVFAIAALPTSCKREGEIFPPPAPVAQVTEDADPYAAERHAMVERLRQEGIDSEKVLSVMAKCPRHEFVPPAQRPFAYRDEPLPIGEDQTISAPYIVAFMTWKLDPQPTDVVLEIGTGSGYQAAILSPLVKHVYTIEIIESLGKSAEKRLKQMGYQNITVRIGDGYQGWPEHAPFDKIIVTCAPTHPPQPLVDQLKEGGIMVIPYGEAWNQNLYILEKREGQVTERAVLPVLFVPMTGEAQRQR